MATTSFAPLPSAKDNVIKSYMIRFCFHFPYFGT